MKTFGRFITCVLIFVSVSAQAKTVTLTVPPPTPIEPYTVTFTADATGIFENYGVTLQFSPFVGYASGTLSGGLQVKEIETPSAVTPVNVGDVVSWPGLFEFPSNATGTWQYTIGDIQFQKELILSQSARTALPSPTAAEFFPGCASPWFVVGDIDFQIDLSGAQLYADGNLFGIEDSTYATRIEVRSATGQEYFVLSRPYLETESGEIRYGWIYYDGNIGVCLYCFESGDWEDGIRFDPTIKTDSQTYLYATSCYTTGGNYDITDIIYGAGYRAKIAVNPAFISASGYNIDDIFITSVELKMTSNGYYTASSPGAAIHGGLVSTTETGFTGVRSVTDGVVIQTISPSATVAGTTDTFDAPGMANKYNEYIHSASATEWMRGFVITSTNEHIPTQYSKYFSDEVAAGGPEFTVTFIIGLLWPRQMRDNNAIIDGENILFYDNNVSTISDYNKGVFSKYYTWTGIGNPIVCPTVSFTTSSIGSAVAGIAIASLPVSHRSHAIIAIASSPGWTKSATTPLSAAGGGGGYTPAEIVEEVYTDSRAFPKSTALSVIQSVSDNVDLESAAIQSLSNSLALTSAKLIRDASRNAAIAAGKLTTDTIQWNIVPVTIPQSATQCALLVGRSLYPSSATFAAVVNRADTSAPNAPPVAGYNHEQGTGITYATSAGTVLGVSEERHFLYWNMVDTDAAASYQMTLIEKDSSGNLIHWPGIVIVHESTPVVDTSGFVTSTAFNSGVAKIMNAATNAGYYRAAIASTTLTKTVAPTETWNPKDLNVPYGQQVLVEQRTTNGSGGWDIQVFVCDYLNNLSIADAIWPITPGLDLEAAADELGIAGSISIATAGANIPN